MSVSHAGVGQRLALALAQRAGHEEQEEQRGEADAHPLERAEQRGRDRAGLRRGDLGERHLGGLHHVAARGVDARGAADGLLDRRRSRRPGRSCRPAATTCSLLTAPAATSVWSTCLVDAAVGRAALALVVGVRVAAGRCPPSRSGCWSRCRPCRRWSRRRRVSFSLSVWVFSGTPFLAYVSFSRVVLSALRSAVTSPGALFGAERADEHRVEVGLHRVGVAGLERPACRRPRRPPPPLPSPAGHRSVPVESVIVTLSVFRPLTDDATSWAMPRTAPGRACRPCCRA